MREQVLAAIRQHKLIAIVRGFEKDDVVWLAKTLYQGGFRMVEMTFDAARPESWRANGEAIAAVREACPDMRVGAGTVLTPEQVEITHAAGGTYIVSPDVNVDVIRRTRELGMVSLPGAMTPTEMMTAHNAGADYVKLFPAGTLGPGYVKAVLAPLRHIKVLAVGGVTAENLPAFLEAGACGAGVGGSLVEKNAVARRDTDFILQQAQAFCRAAQG